MTSSSVSDPVLADVEAAADRIASTAIVTPLLESPLLNDRLGFRLFVKAEPLQRTGSFKFRGAMNRLAQLDTGERGRGVVAFSSGNHAQGVALAAKLLGVPAVIVMPADAPAIKIANTRAYGAEVVLYDRRTEDREAIGAKYASDRGMTVVPPYEDARIIAGQGTVGLEICRQLDGLGLKPGAVLANTSGGGLIAGVAIAVRALAPAADIFTCEPADFDDMGRSLVAGRRVANPPGGVSQCDALLAATPGEITFRLAQPRLTGGLAVTDAEVDDAMRAAFEYFKLVVEPGGAVALASVLKGRLPRRYDNVVVVASGGNVDAPAFAAALNRAQPL
ncbi:MAG: threonine ammonia-lyase [Ferrovibrionaceae bacterium]